MRGGLDEPRDRAALNGPADQSDAIVRFKNPAVWKACGAESFALVTLDIKPLADEAGSSEARRRAGIPSDRRGCAGCAG